MKTYPSFQTTRLILKPTALDDALFIHQLLNTPKWIQYIGNRNVKTIEDAKTYIETKVSPQFESLGFGSYTIITKSSHTKIGTCGLYNRAGLEGVDIGFALLPNYEQQGYAFEAAQKIKELALTDFNVKRISAITTKDNLASQRLLEKLDLQVVGTTVLPNDDEVLLLYKLEYANERV